MNTQKQITLMVALVFLLLGGCAAYTVYDQNRENDAAAFQTEKLAERGARIFGRYCLNCHGNAGEGRIGPRLDRPDLRDPATRAETVTWVTDTITCGRIGKIMPAWAIREGGALNDEQIKDLVTLITTGGSQSGQGGSGWEKAAEFSAETNRAANPPGLPPIEDVLKAAPITGSTNRVCGQLAPATETPAPSGELPAGLTPAATWTENATDNKFDVTAIAVNAGQAATLNFNNKGAAIHNWEVLDSTGAAVLKDDSGKPISLPLTNGGASASISFTLSTPGVYNFRCQVHPTEMTGKLYVVGANGQAGAAATATPAAAAASPAPANNSPTEVTTDNKFSVTNITVTGGQQVTLKIQNNGQALHNFDVLDVKDDSGKDIKTDFVNPGQTLTFTLTISKKGTYNFRCDVHPDEMKGTFTVQ